MPNPDNAILWLRNQAITSTNVSVSIADARQPDVPLIDVNPAFVKLTGYTREEAIGWNCRFLQGPRSDRSVSHAIGDAIRARRESHTALLNYRKDGGTFWNEIRISPVYDADGALTHFVATQMDVTTRVRYEQFQRVLNDIDPVIGTTLEPSEIVGPVAQVIADSICDACTVYTTDGADTIHRKAASMARLLDTIPDQRDAVREGLRSFFMRSTVERAIRTRELATDTVELHRADATGEPYRYGVVAAPILGPSRAYGAIAFAVDLSIRPLDPSDEQLGFEIGHRLGNVYEMAQLYADLNKAIEVRDQFLSIAAHELRTPISSIKGYSQLLMRGLERGTLIPERLRLGLRTIELSASRLSTLTNDLLEVSRDGSNRVPLHVEQVSVFGYVAGFLREREGMQPDGHTFALDSEDPRLLVQIDRARIDQVLSNLASNAVKYSAPEHPVQVRVTAEDGGAAILIRDTGIGIHPGDLESIFQPFQRSRVVIEANIAGMGLGLFISRNIAERHGGQLTAHSEGPGMGTTFRIWLPATPESAPGEGASGG